MIVLKCCSIQQSEDKTGSSIVEGRIWGIIGERQ